VKYAFQKQLWTPGDIGRHCRGKSPEFPDQARKVGMSVVQLVDGIEPSAELVQELIELTRQHLARFK
jgi:hypothetical protein